MPESLNLTTPDQVKAGTSQYQVVDLNKHRGLKWDGSALVSVPAESSIKIIVMGTGGITREFWITGTEADALLIAFNKANLSTKSEQKRTLEWLRDNRDLAGSVSGTPE